MRGNLVVLTEPTSIGLYTGTVAPTWTPKDPAEVIKYFAQFAYLDCQRNPIVQLDVDICPFDAASVVKSHVSGDTVELELAGGMNRVPALVAIIVTLSDGQRFLGAVTLPVIARARTLILRDEITVNGLGLTIGGQPLLAGNDFPITVERDPVLVSGTPIRVEL